ncbi:MAG: PHP domain-containing protein [Treponema sp.]|jgi:predicted metal-dependent phosphoesterase TrpH|nr:PHP domain-containing protein [Treponema sp.]
MIDLHTHSTASDGSCSPRELIREASRRGLNAIALTDHDTIDGLQEGRDEAERLGIHFVPGIEIEIEQEPEKDGWPSGGEFHLLGLGIEKPAPSFLEMVKDLQKFREERNQEILNRMEEQGIEVKLEDIAAFSKGSSIGRPHFAAFLVNRKLVKNIEQAFSRYLGSGQVLHVPKKGVAFERATAAIQESGGIPVMAHPLSLYLAWGKLPAFIARLKERGLSGLEAWHPAARTGECKRLEKLGKTLNLYITEGSDYHGEARKGRQLGLTAGGKKIEDSVLEAIPELREAFPKL